MGSKVGEGDAEEGSYFDKATPLKRKKHQKLSKQEVEKL
jgi:hypothetical protein